MEVDPLNSRTRTRGALVGRTRVAAVALATVFALALPTTGLAQDATQSPAASAAPAVDASGIDFPVMLGGQLLAAETFSGPEWLARAAEGATNDPTYAERTQALVESVGKSIDDLTVRTALVRADPR